MISLLLDIGNISFQRDGLGAASMCLWRSLLELGMDSLEVDRHLT
jgi:hypothetical protein